MVISTVTLSPAIDRTYYVENFVPDALNRAWRVKENTGGKGINFSSAISSCGMNCTATGFLCDDGSGVENFLNKKNIKTRFVRTGGTTRVNIKICDLEKNTYTEINECGSNVSEEEFKKLLETVSEIAKESDFLYMGGTLPPGIPDDAYCKFIEAGRRAGVVTILDGSGEALSCAIGAKPHIIKPNRCETEILLGRRIKSTADAATAAKDIVSLGIPTVLLSLGGDGSVAADENCVYRVLPLHVPVKSTVGAGDSFLAGFVFATSQNMGIVTALKYAASFAAAKIQKEGTDMPSFDELIENTENVICEKIE